MGKKQNSGVARSPEAAWVDPDDAPEQTAEDFARAHLYHGEKLIRRGVGRPPLDNPKKLVSLRIDQDVLERLRALGPGWQTKAAEALREFAYSVQVT
jgi:uncharacterized protein (DUF4415 family)